MAPLPENNTPRLYIDYRSGGQAHTAIIRLGMQKTSQDAITAYNALKTPMLALMYSSDAITGARFSEKGSNLSFPLNVTVGSGSTTGTPDPELKTAFISFTGRGSTGRRVRFTLFTPVVNPVTDTFRQNTPSTGVQALWNAVTGQTVGAVDIAGNTPSWHTYVNVGLNSYFQRKFRRT